MRSRLALGSLGALIFVVTSPSFAFAATVTVPDTGLNIILPSDGSVYAVSTGSTFDQLDISGGTFTFTMTAGESVTITAPDSRDLVNNGGISYSCSSQTILTIPATGSIVVTVTPTIETTPLCSHKAKAPTPVLTTITLSPSTATLVVGKTSSQQLTPTTLDQLKNTIVPAALTWKSSNTAVATVNATGLVTPVAAGTATITVSSAGITSAPAVITVTPQSSSPVVATVKPTTPTTTPTVAPKKAPATTPPATTPLAHTATPSATPTNPAPAVTPSNTTTSTSVTAPKSSSANVVPTQVFTRTLSLGMSGNDVLQLQKLLLQQGFYPQGELTGYFGSSTKQAVIRFQLKYSLPATGIIDLKNRNILNKILTP